VKDVPCAFPFYYRGITYNTCTTYDSRDGRPWCATRVDRFGNYITRNWGYCDTNCPSEYANVQRVNRADCAH
jgi:hypothetical protein